MFHGFDFDATMLRIAAMNLMLHGVENPDIHYQDTLSNSFPEKFPKQATERLRRHPGQPAVQGQPRRGDVHPSLTQKVKTKKTELLFVALILRMLKKGGRCAAIVPDGVLFGSSKAHVALRKMLVEENQLEAVITLPSGVFKPYAGVSTAILVFTKGGKTDHVFFYDVEADGFSLDDKRDPVERERPAGRAGRAGGSGTRRRTPTARPSTSCAGEGDRGEELRPLDQPLQGSVARGSEVRPAEEDHREAASARGGDRERPEELEGML